MDATAIRGLVGGGGGGSGGASSGRDDGPGGGGTGAKGGGLCLVLGSEGQGLSEAALESCQPVAIPMPGEMESLNVVG